MTTSFGGPEVLELREVAQPQASSGQLRVRVAVAGLNPMDWLIIGDEALGAAFGVRPPTGFGTTLPAWLIRSGRSQRLHGR